MTAYRLSYDYRERDNISFSSFFSTYSIIVFTVLFVDIHTIYIRIRFSGKLRIHSLVCINPPRFMSRRNSCDLPIDL